MEWTPKWWHATEIEGEREREREIEREEEREKLYERGVHLSDAQAVVDKCYEFRVGDISIVDGGGCYG